jgi:hypothetical protein
MELPASCFSDAVTLLSASGRTGAALDHSTPHPRAVAGWKRPTYGSTRSRSGSAPKVVCQLPTRQSGLTR